MTITNAPPGSGARPCPRVPGVTHRFLTVRGVRMHMAEAGSGDPVLLLHGFPQHGYAWRHVIPLAGPALPAGLPGLAGIRLVGDTAARL